MSHGLHMCAKIKKRAKDTPLPSSMTSSREVLSEGSVTRKQLFMRVVTLGLWSLLHCKCDRTLQVWSHCPTKDQAQQ